MAGRIRQVQTQAECREEKRMEPVIQKGLQMLVRLVSLAETSESAL